MKVIVAMSGGVDSSVAAYLLKKQGHEVIGLSFELWDKRDLAPSNVCCSVETIALARAVARELGIEHHTVDVRDHFYRHVIEEFCESYVKGLTPNPCILCNKYIKFNFLLEKARELDAPMVATGHYARIIKSSELGVRSSELKKSDSLHDPRNLLLKGIDARKDQSYVLYVMKQEELSQTLFPLGDMRKDDIRRIAGDIGLSNALRPESQEICFVGDEGYAEFIRNFSPAALQPGRLVDTSGKFLGEHKGIAFYTIGQRRGLGISSPDPYYVVDIDRECNRVVVGSREDVYRKTIKVNTLNWISIPPLSRPRTASAKIRSTMKETPCRLVPESDDHMLVTFDEPQWAPAPGQSAVFYENDIVLGGGIIGKREA